MLGGTAVMLLLLLPWAAQARAVSGSSSPSWAQCQRLSRKLCTLAWSAHPSAGHVDPPREEGDEENTDGVPHIRCGDGCDPQGLKDSSRFCLQRIYQGLVFYQKLLGSDIFTGDPALLPDGLAGQLQASLLRLSQLLQPEGPQREPQTPSLSPSQPWQRLLLRVKILRSLQAFVAVAARVFGHGAANLSP
ncbi:PREDICTED: interleukin-23 subunit alpha [Chinchilla lanigera]|uniref:Interleukin-23 subunit alpha n=1 Tax=Chinchilla lanigera TaxID=34839 RepID=A0A8C2YQU6_CHILA|nr:PREDICTED: interleukin-23 subunit alpha [Chinchilla lanigera]